jgi:hypothetical protein
LKVIVALFVGGALLWLAFLPSKFVKDDQLSFDETTVTEEQRDLQVHMTEYGWDFSGTYTYNYLDWRIDCGSVDEPNHPPRVTQVGTRVHETGSLSEDNDAYFLDATYEEAVAAFHAQYVPQVDPPPNSAMYVEKCNKAIAQKSTAAFFASPLGWVIIVVALLLTVVIALMFVGGGGGGWSGSVTPAPLGGFVVRLWK